MVFKNLRYKSSVSNRTQPKLFFKTVDKDQKKKQKKAYLEAQANKKVQAEPVCVPPKPENSEKTGAVFVEAFLFFLFISLGVGWIYWGVLAWQLGSWLMLVGLVLFPIGAILGFWSLVFGTPEWIFYVFS